MSDSQWDDADILSAAESLKHALLDALEQRGFSDPPGAVRMVLGHPGPKGHGDRVSSAGPSRSV